MELIHVKGNTYCIKNNTNIGIYKIDDKNIYLIDENKIIYGFRNNYMYYKIKKDDM